MGVCTICGFWALASLAFTVLAAGTGSVTFLALAGFGFLASLGAASFFFFFSFLGLEPGTSSPVRVLYSPFSASSLPTCQKVKGKQ